MSKREEPTIEVKLFIDREKGKVLFAESDKEFVDVLLSFLTLPLGTVVRLLGKQSQIGCLDQIYKSVEELSSDDFQTKACKSMVLSPRNAASSHCDRLVLSPRNAASSHCDRLKINVDDSNPWAVYVCKDEKCRYGEFSLVPDAICKCGKDKVMQYAGNMPVKDRNLAPCPGGGNTATGVFVKGGYTFIITDDLMVAPSSTSLVLSLCERSEIRNPAVIEQTIIQLTSQKIISLLQRSLTSKEPLTDLYFDNPVHNGDLDLSALPDELFADQESDTVLSKLEIRVVHTKDSSLLYTEVSDGFVDLLFGLLSVPIGSVIKTYGQCSGCLYNLYKSIDADPAKECVKSGCLSMLVTPKSAAFSGCGATKVIHVEKSAPKILECFNACYTCIRVHGFSDHGPRCQPCCRSNFKSASFSEVNPKSPNEGTENGEVYMKPIKFMLTSDLRILPLRIQHSSSCQGSQDSW